MKNILAFGASTSPNSINRQFAVHTAKQIAGALVDELDLRDFDLPIYSIDREESDGIPADVKAFLERIRACDAVVISMAEHNGSYTAAFKNLYDWTSRLEQKVWSGKPMLVLATSPGARGAATVLAAAAATFPRMGGEPVLTFSLPSFYDNFNESEGVTDPVLKTDLAIKLDEFEAELNKG